MPPTPSEAKMFVMLKHIANGTVKREQIRADMLKRLDALAEDTGIERGTPAWKIEQIASKRMGG